MAVGGDTGRSLEITPTWAVAVVCTIFVVVSYIGERSLHLLGHWLSRTRRKPLFEALEKMKEELMLLGFISLLITVTSPYISKICVKSSFYDKHYLPCNLETRKTKDSKNDEGSEHLLITRRLSVYLMEQVGLPRRELAGATNECGEGKEPFVSFLGLEQLHRFIFVMACTHVFYSCLTMLLAIMKIYSWRSWEHEAHTRADNQENMAELCRNMTMRRQSTFVAYHTSTPGSRNRIFLWVLCFFRQFGQAVTKSDYLALRLGFITKHTTGAKYDFHSYMIRTMEDEFKDIVGISPLFWIFIVCFMLFNVDGSNLYFWTSFLPVVLVLLVGAKLQHVIAQLALENSGLSGPLTGVHLRPRDSLFWFRRPRLMLHLIHFILFQDAFELATFFWVWWQFDWDSCYMSKKSYAYTRLVTGFLVQVLCSYSTLPLYALVTQMGSHYKKAIFQDNIVESLHNWKRVAKKRAKEGGSYQSDEHGTNGHEDDQDEGERYTQESPSAPAEIELEAGEIPAISSRLGKVSPHLRNVEKVPNVFTSPKDSLLSPRPEFGADNLAAEMGSYGKQGGSRARDVESAYQSKQSSTRERSPLGRGDSRSSQEGGTYSANFSTQDSTKTRS